LEYMAAFGSANSALLLDENCGCAKLTLAYISSANSTWGSRAKKLKEINTSDLTSEEKAWFDYMSASSEDQKSLEKSMVEKFPKSPLINFLPTSIQDFNSYKIFAEKFPEYSSSAYNMMSYGYMNGAYGEKDTAQALKYVKMSQNSHDGPNSYDSMAEHYASLGDFEKALELELKAIDFATFASPYSQNAQIYFSKINKEDLSKELMKKQREAQDAITNQNYETFSKFEHPEINHITGDSNLSPFYTFSKASFDVEPAITWNRFDMNDMQVNFSPDMKTAVLTFYGDGSYVFKDTKEEVAYSTRGSSVWVNTNQGWKIMHSSWAPNKDGKGIPQS